MANIKITQLPAASAISASDDVLPIVHSGVTEKATPNQIVNQVLASPGAIGGSNANAGAFTTLTASNTVTLSPEAGVYISPTGGGGQITMNPAAGMYITPATLGYMNNMAIGGTTPQSAAFTTLTSNSDTTLNGTSIPASKTLVDTDSVQTLSSKYYLNPRIWDPAQDNYYRITPVSTGLTTDVYCFLPSLPGNDYFVFRNFTETLTNKTISGASNTLTDIPNSSFQYSSITLGSTSISLGGTASSISGLALTGGTVNNTAIGGTTPAAGNFTTLGATGNVTLGDASGDTLTINGTAVSAPNGLNVNSNQLVLSGGNFGVGISPANKLHVYGDGSASLLKLQASNTNGNAAMNLVPNGTGNGIIYTESGSLYLSPASTTRAVVSAKGLLVDYTSDSGLSGTGNAIFSGSVGIGTSSPTGAKLESAGIGALIGIKQNATGSTCYYRLDNTVETGGKTWRLGYTGASGIPTFSLYNQTDNVLCWLSDASGNLGLGVTPDNSYNACLQLKSGITFPATQVASSNVNTLDDYEEGNWTPVIGGNTGATGQTYTTQVGRYVKIGKQVFVTAMITLSAKGTFSGATYTCITGLPFVATSVDFNAGVDYYVNLSTAIVNAGGYVAGGTNTIYLTASTGATTYLIATGFSQSYVQDNTTIYCTATYFV